MEMDETKAPSALIPAATVIIIRDGQAGLETLMLRRNKSLKAFGGVWVFPGGRVDAADLPGGDEMSRAKAAAIREAKEEADLDLSADSLIHLSQWIPPKVEIRRFSTHFFIAPMPNQSVKIDEGEIHDYRWVCPKQAVAATPDPALKIFPPTYVSLWELAKYETVAGVMQSITDETSLLFETLFVQGEGGHNLFWRPDAGYDGQDITASGPRHRLLMGKDRWRYERDFPDHKPQDDPSSE